MQPRKGRPFVLGHRGYRAKFPENTLRGFREALAAGADGIELDVQKTADGRYVVIHDPSTERVTGTRLDVGRETAERLQRLDAGGGEAIPLLEEVLESSPGAAWIDLEVKEETVRVSDAAAIADLVDRRKSRERLMISSFSLPLLLPFRRRGFTVGYLVGEEAARRGLRGLAADLLRLRPQFLNLPVETVGVLGAARAEVLFRLLRILGISLLFWTVNEPFDARRLARHAAFLVTDEVELVAKALEGHRARP